jgi:ABC-type glycerol-3-phosphate transport system substrate-binding protein
MTTFKTTLALAATALALAACGGGGGGDAQPAPADPLEALPSGATQSVSAWIGFLETLTRAAGADQREGFGVSSNGVTSVPGDDAAEPSVLMP